MNMHKMIEKPEACVRAAFGLGVSALFAAVLALLLGVVPAARATVSGSGLQMYVEGSGNPGTVTPFSLSTDTFGSPISVGDDPFDVIRSPDGSTLYVLNFDGESISVIDTATGLVTKTFDLATENLYYPHPDNGAISPDGKTLYISDYYYDTYAINAQTGALEATYGTGSVVYPFDTVMSPSGGHVLVLQYEGGTNSEGAVESIDTATGAVTTESISTLTPPAGDLPFTYPYFMAVSPSGEYLYIVGYPYDAATNSYDNGIAVLDRASGQITQEFNFGSDRSYGLAQDLVSPDGAWLYVTDDESSGGVYLIDLATGSMQEVSLDDPYAEAVSPDGTRLYVDSFQSTVGYVMSVIDVNPASLHFATVLATVSGAPSSGAIAMGNPAIYADPSGLFLAEPAGPVSGSLSTDVVNPTSCLLTYSLTSPSPDGDFSFSASNGSFELTPTVADLPAVSVFSWQAAPPATCTADDAPTEPAAIYGAVTVTWLPTLSGLSPLTLTSGQSSGTVTFNVYSSAPVTLSASSSNPAAVPPGLIDLASDCQGLCTLTLTAGSAGSSTVTVTATEPSGLTGSDSFSVAVSPAPTSGGGGLVGPWVLLGLLAFVLVRRRRMAASA